MKKAIAILTALTLLLLCGCTKNQENPFDNTANTEEIIAFSAQNVLNLQNKIVTNVAKLDSTYYISYFDNADGLEHISEYDESFRYLKDLTGDMDELSQTQYRQSAFCLNGDSIYFVYMPESDMSNRQLIRYSLDGQEISRVTLDTPSDVWDGRVLDDIYVTDDNVILVSGSGVQLCDKNGHTISEFTNNDKSPYYIDASAMDENGNLYFSCTEEYVPYLYKIDSSNGEVYWKKSFSFGNHIRNICVKENIVYIQNEYLIQKVNEEENTIADICDIRDYNATTSASEDVSYYSKVFRLLAEPDGFLYMYTNNVDSSDVVKMTFSDDKTSNTEGHETAKKEIHIFLPYKDNLLTDLFYSFEKDTGISVIAEYYSDSFMDFNTSDYLQVVSTRILSGNCGWDIMSTEIVPYIPYAQNGYFADLYSLKRGNELQDDSIVHKNIVDACAWDGKLFYFPMSISFLGMIDQDDPATFSSIDALRERCLSENRKLRYDKDAVYATLFKYVFTSFCRMDFDELYFDSEEYQKIAASLKEIYSADIYSSAFGYSPDYIDLYEEEYIDPSKNLDAYGSFSYVPLNDRNSFAMGVGYAVMQDSAVKDESLDLLLFISEHYDMRYGIHRDQNERKINQLIESCNSNMFMESDPEKAEEYKDRILKALNSLDFKIYYDTDLYSLAYDQTLAVCKGENTLENAAKRIEQAFTVYQNEVKLAQ